MIRGLRILVVDDSVNELAPLLALLRRLGTDPVAATSVRTARDILASGARFDCAIIDLLLLNGNGANLIREIELTTPELATVLHSGADLETIGLEGYEGVFLSKPARIDEVEAAILRAIQNRRAKADTDPSELSPDSEPPTMPG